MDQRPPSNQPSGVPPQAAQSQAPQQVQQPPVTADKPAPVAPVNALAPSAAQAPAVNSAPKPPAPNMAQPIAPATNAAPKPPAGNVARPVAQAPGAAPKPQAPNVAQPAAPAPNAAPKPPVGNAAPPPAPAKAPVAKQAVPATGQKQTHVAAKKAPSPAENKGGGAKIAAIIFAVLFVVASVLAVLQFMSISSIRAEANTRVEAANSQLAALQAEIGENGSKMPIFNQYARFIVFEDRSVYHNYDCPVFQNALESQAGWMLVDKEYAENELGASPCPQCGG